MENKKCLKPPTSIACPDMANILLLHGGFQKFWYPKMLDVLFHGTSQTEMDDLGVEPS